MQLNDFRKLARFKDIVAILVKYGFDEIVERLEVPGAGYLRQIHPHRQDISVYARIRLALEDLGPTFIKFGQIMSLRPDLLPKEFLQELEKLQDDVPPDDSEDIVKIVEQGLGRPVSDIFAEFNDKPLAAASLSQVYRGVLKIEGKTVAVKVQRPGIAANIKSDLDILESICRFLDHQVDDLKTYDLPKVVHTVRATLIKELDFTLELRNMNIARAYAADTEIHIPATYEQYSSETVLVMEYVLGVNFKEIVPGSAYDTQPIARMAIHALARQILEDGYFHADPHPGNLLIDEDMKLCIIDWGMVGRLTEKDRFMMIELLKAIVDRDSDALLHSFLRLCQTRGRLIEPRVLERELLAVLDTHYYAVPIKDMNIGQLLLGLTALIREHELQLPSDLLIMIKALVTAEGSVRHAFPEMDVISEIREYVYQIALRRFSPEVLWRNLRNTFVNFWFSQNELPIQLKHIVTKLETGELGFLLHLEKLEQLMSSLENASNRLTTGIIAGSIIMGSSMIITTGIGPYIFGYPALGVVGYLLSVIMGMWLVITILRNKR